MNILDSIKGWLGVSNRVNADKARQSLEKDVNEFLAYFMTAKNSHDELGIAELSKRVDDIFLKIDYIEKFIKISNEKINLNLNNPDVQKKHNKIIKKIEELKEKSINKIINAVFIDPHKPSELSNEHYVMTYANDMIKLKISLEEKMVDFGKEITRKQTEIVKLNNRINESNSSNAKLSFFLQR